MVNLLEEAAFWEHVAKHNNYVQHKPNGDKLKLEKRFARFNDEGTIGETTGLGLPRLEMRDTPAGTLFNQTGFMYDEMLRTIRILGKAKANDMADKLQVQHECKKALVEIATWIIDEQDSDRCSSNIIKLFDTKTFTYQLIENAGSDGALCGCEMRVKLRCKVKLPAAGYPTFIYTE